MDDVYEFRFHVIYLDHVGARGLGHGDDMPGPLYRARDRRVEIALLRGMSSFRMRDVAQVVDRDDGTHTRPHGNHEVGTVIDVEPAQRELHGNGCAQLL